MKKIIKKEIRVCATCGKKITSKVLRQCPVCIKTMKGL